MRARRFFSISGLEICRPTAFSATWPWPSRPPLPLAQEGRPPQPSGPQTFRKLLVGPLELPRGVGSVPMLRCLCCQEAALPL
jgi:hypothetical protein